MAAAGNERPLTNFYFLKHFSSQVFLTRADSAYEDTVAARNTTLEPAKPNTPDPAPAQGPQGRDRRRNSRFFCDGTVDVNRIPSTGMREGKLKDLSPAGCFVEMANPFSAPSYIEIVIDTGTSRMRLAGTVRTCRKNGMGVEFAKAGAGGRMLLQDLIEELEWHNAEKA
jgi:hypothetical protein